MLQMSGFWCYNINQIHLMNRLRLLWQQHVMWTRSFIISTAADLGDLKAVTNRLLQNPKDFAQLLSFLYGDLIANKFNELFTNHLLIAADLVNAAKKGDEQAMNTAREKWYENAAQIAKFLSSINPHWDENQWKILLDEHLKMTENEAASYLKGEYEKSIMLYDSIENQAMEMADYMFQGIARQFSI